MKTTKEMNLKTTKGGINHTSHIPPHTSQRGITLIALVITIIVMLILVSVTITMAVNGGLFDYAGKAVGDTKNELEKEGAIASGGITVDGVEYSSIDDYLNKKPKAGTYGISEKDANGYLTEKATYSDGVEEKPVVVPAGYKLVNEGEKIANGIVIADSNGNEFVWIPVKKAIVTEAEIAKIREEDTSITTDKKAVEKLVRTGTFPMAVQVGENYKGILYEFKGTNTLTAETTVYDWTSTSSYREPAILEDSKTWETATTVNGTAVEAGTSYVYDSQNMFDLFGVGTYSNTLYQDAYNKMVESVAANGGFFVGRYEISSGTYTLENGSTVTYAQSKPNQTVLYSTEWYNMYKYERDYAKYNSNLGVTSEMIWSSQWDQMMIFVNGKNDGATAPFYVTTHADRRTGTSSSTLTGNNAVDKVANIFDLEASRREWTQEATSSDYRVFRGSFYLGRGVASGRYYYAPTYSGSYDDSISSRATLYIK